jgi:hypothetical protein
VVQHYDPLLELLFMSSLAGYAYMVIVLSFLLSRTPCELKCELGKLTKRDRMDASGGGVQGARIRRP